MQVNKAARKSCSSELFEFRSNTKGQNQPEAAGFLRVILVFLTLMVEKQLSWIPSPPLFATYDFKKARVAP